MTIEEIAQKMIAGSNGNLHDINHFLKVWSFARIIGRQEKLDEKTQETLEIAALVHDIACPLCREKYGNTNGNYQEREGEPLTREFLKDSGLSEEKQNRIVWLVGHHHTYTEIDGMDYQILLEADYLVNADESHYSQENIRNVVSKVFKTETGKALIESMYVQSV